MAEAAAKHRSSVSVLEEQYKAEIKGLNAELKSKIAELDDEKQLLVSSVGKLKRQSMGELKQASDALEHEKQLHHGTRERYERRVAELKERHADGLKRVESDWMQKLAQLEKTVNERADKVTSATEGEWKKKLAKVTAQHEEEVGSLRKEFEMELATANQQTKRASGFEESYQEAARELTAVQGQLESVTRDLADAHKELEERDSELAQYERRSSENKETIDSLKSVIDDFSRSIDSYLQDRDEQNETITSLKQVIADMYRSIDAKQRN